MAKTWGQVQTQLRRVILNDTEYTAYSDPDLLKDALEMALITLAQHTAMATATSVTLDANQSVVNLPAELFESPENAGLVFYEGSTTASRQYLAPVNYTPKGDLETEGFYILPDTQLNLTTTSTTSRVLTLQYFAHYPVPVNDDSLVYYPSWGYAALLLFTGAYAFTHRVVDNAEINRWNNREQGPQEASATMQMQKHLFELAETELRRYPTQDRVNYWTVDRG